MRVPNVYIRQYTSPNEHFEYRYPHSNTLLLQFRQIGAPTKCDVISDVKLFPTVYSRIYCRKGVRALRGYFGPLGSHNLKVALHQILLIALLDELTQVNNSGIYLNFYGCYGNKNGLKIRLKIEKLPFWTKF